MRWQSVQHQMPNSGANHTDLLSELDEECHVEPDKTNADRYYKQKMNCVFGVQYTVATGYAGQRNGIDCRGVILAVVGCMCLESRHYVVALGRRCRSCRDGRLYSVFPLTCVCVCVCVCVCYKVTFPHKSWCPVLHC